MLKLTRKAGQTIQIGDDITIVVTEVCGRSVRVGVVAPRDLLVLRGELLERGEGEAVEAVACPA